MEPPSESSGAAGSPRAPQSPDPFSPGGITPVGQQRPVITVLPQQPQPVPPRPLDLDALASVPLYISPEISPKTPRDTLRRLAQLSRSRTSLSDLFEAGDIPVAPLSPERSDETVLERQFDIGRFAGKPASPRAGKGVGFLKALSVDRSVWPAMEKTCEARIPRTPDGNILYDTIFGSRYDADHRIAPGYDSMGSFPAFEDDQAREYFLGVMPQEDPDRRWVWGVRIRRQETRAQYDNAYRTPFKPITQLPYVNAMVEFKPVGLPLFPLYWDAWSRKAVSVTKDADRLDASLGVIRRLVSNGLFKQTERGIVLEVIGEKEASCALRVRLSQPLEILEAIEEVRRSYSIHVAEFITEMLSTNQHPITTANILTYLKVDWLPRATAWAKSVSKR